MCERIRLEVAPEPPFDGHQREPFKIPTMCGTVRRNPKVAPEAVSMTLFGPGVIAVETAKGSSAAMKESNLEGTFS